MSSLFTKIIQGEIPCHKLYEDEQFFAFLDINPISEGHSLVIPKHETDYFFDLNDTELSSILVFSRPIAAAIRAAVPCKRIGIMVAGLDVPHAHLHLVPIKETGHLSFAYAKPARPEDLQKTADAIRSKL